MSIESIIYINWTGRSSAGSKTDGELIYASVLSNEFIELRLWFLFCLLRFLDGFLSRALNPFYYIKFIYENSPHSREQRRQIEIVHRLPREVSINFVKEKRLLESFLMDINEFHFQMIAKKKEEFLKTNQSGKADSTPEIGEDDDRDYETPQIFINELFKLQQKGMMDDKEMRDEVFLMVKTLRQHILSLSYPFYSFDFRSK